MSAGADRRELRQCRAPVAAGHGGASASATTRSTTPTTRADRSATAMTWCCSERRRRWSGTAVRRLRRPRPTTTGRRRATGSATSRRGRRQAGVQRRGGRRAAESGQRLRGGHELRLADAGQLPGTVTSLSGNALLLNAAAAASSTAAARQHGGTGRADLATSRRPSRGDGDDLDVTSPITLNSGGNLRVSGPTSNCRRRHIDVAAGHQRRRDADLRRCGRQRHAAGRADHRHASAAR